MSVRKPQKKGTVSKGELVFDQNLNPLQSKKPKKISLQAYLSNRSAISTYRGEQGVRRFDNNTVPQLKQGHSVGHGHLLNIPHHVAVAPQYPHLGHVPRISEKQPTYQTLEPSTPSHGQSQKNFVDLSESTEIAQDALSEAMDMSSDDDDSGDDLSEIMDVSSGPEAYDISSDEEVPNKAIGGTTSSAMNLKCEQGTDDKTLFSIEPTITSNPLAKNNRALIDSTSDATSQTARTSTTPSRISAPSSNTSAGPSHSNESTDDSAAPFDSLKAPLRPASLSSELSPAKSTTPPALKPISSAPKLIQRRNLPKGKRLRFSDFQPRSSIPSNIPPTVIAQQGIHAAYSSRLNPFSLHPDEYRLLRDHICHLHVTAYLNVRNRILRLWVRNPLVSVTTEEAAGCAQSTRWLGLAEVAYEWLIRRGYINFGCVQVPDTSDVFIRRYKAKRYQRKTVVVIGAGMSGIGCARQLEGLLEHYKEKWTSIGQEPPRVVLLEGRNRIGGRVYSHPLRDQKTKGIPDQKRSTAEMGAHIIIGFDHGNPLNMIVRGQLALHYYPLKDNSTLHDIDGRVVNEERDSMVEKLYNDCLDRASVYRHRVDPPRTVEGDKTLIETGRDPIRDEGRSIADVEAETPYSLPNTQTEMVENVPGGMDKLTGKAHMITGPRRKQPPARAAEIMGWKLSSNVLAYHDLNLDVVAKASRYPTLGAAMDEAVKQYQFLLDLSPQDLRLLNWHYANLEYANAANVGKLSLGGWDQDAGNEFEGKHAQVIGGYQQVPRALLQSPTKLDLHTRKVVQRITYESDKNVATHGTRVLCEDGEVYEADHVVLTAPLGVLKSDTIQFDPPLPDWKYGPISRLGFGILNKVILVFSKPFWDVDQDMFGLLREPEVRDSVDQEDYIANRGRFYFFWNCIKTTGRPVLISLMAGDAAHQAENSDDAELVLEVTKELKKIFSTQTVPEPLETIVTRWGKDRFARGSYSYVGATSLPGDYENLARPVGRLHFAGEATCATHPATVHGAYISGLRAASEVIEDLIGPIEIPNPLVPWPNQGEDVSEPLLKLKMEHSYPTAKIPASIPKQTPLAPSAPSAPPAPPAPPATVEDRATILDAFENDILNHIFSKLGGRPITPIKPRANAFHIYTAAKISEMKKACDKARVAATGDPEAKANINDARIMTGERWRTATEEERRPYKEKQEFHKREYEEKMATLEARQTSWEIQAREIRRMYIQEHPDVMSQEEVQDMWKNLGVPSDFGDREKERRAKRMSGYAGPDNDMDL